MKYLIFIFLFVSCTKTIETKCTEKLNGKHLYILTHISNEGLVEDFRLITTKETAQKMGIFKMVKRGHLLATAPDSETKCETSEK